MRSIILACLNRRPLVIVSFFAILSICYVAFAKLNIEAYPDPAPPIIEIIAQWPGQSPEEVERYVTIPIEIGLANTPGLKFIRSNTIYALGFIRLQFEYGQDYNFVRQQTLNRLKDVSVPSGVQPVISPAGGISEIYRYELKGPPGMSLTELKSIQDWVVERKIRQASGVADVVVLGGMTKEYQVEIDLDKMIAYGMTLPQILTAVSANNANVGGRTISVGEQSVNVRGIGLAQSLKDIGNTILTQQNGVPVLLSDIARLQIGHTPRLGIAGRDADGDVVTGIVLMQKGERTMDVVDRVRAVVARINTDGSLPPGVKLEPFYDRGDLVAVTVHTVLHNLLFGVVLIFVIQWVFLGNLRCALIVAATIPFALGIAVLITVWRGESANLLSVGAIDLGIIVDATVIMVENIFRHLAHHDSDHADADVSALQTKLRRVLRGAVEVNSGVIASVCITIAAFIPLFTMQGVEGQIFSPMARTYAYALLGAVFATLTVTPVLSSVILPAHVDEIETLFVRAIRFFYESILPILVRRHKSTLTIAVAFLLACGAIATRLGTEFLPKLEEGNLWIRASLPPTISLEAGVQTVTRIREIIKSYPEAVTVFSNHGRGEDGTDPTGSFNAEFFVPLQPFDEWPAGMTKERLVAELSEKLNRELIGVDFNFSQYIQDNIEETLSGVKGENSVKIFGAELAQLQDLAHRAKTELEKVPGVREPGEFNLLGQPNLIIAIDRDKAVRFGIAVADINTVVQAAIGGQEVTRVYEGERNFAVTVRLSSAYRTNVEAIKSIPVAVAPSDPKSSVAYIPLSDLANVRIESGASFIYRENGQRYVPIKYSVRERDLGSTVADAQRALAEHLPLPEGHRLEWAGEFGALQEAKARLFTIVPLGLVLIVMILFALFNSMRDSLLAISAIPFAVCGGVLGLWLSGLNLSVSAAVGFISLFGVSAMDGILLVSCIRQNVADGLDTEHAIIDAARTRMRQIFMTGLSACIGLVPSAISTGIGSQVQRPLACVIVGGMLLSPLFSLTIIPALARLVFPLIPVGLGHESDAAPSEELASPEQASAAELGAEL